MTSFDHLISIFIKFLNFHYHFFPKCSQVLKIIFDMFVEILVFLKFV